MRGRAAGRAGAGMVADLASLATLATVAAFATVATLASLASATTVKPPTCSSDIYCHGPLLHTVQMASVFPDSKTFVDMKMRHGREETLLRFGDMMKKSGEQPPDPGAVAAFVTEMFEEAGSEFEPWTPSDWVERPRFLSRVSDPAYKNWAFQLNHLWKDLGRKMKEDVRAKPELYSIIWVPNPVIVPGGRFREFYYWDSYWIVRGLLLSEMFQTVKGMLSNFLSLVNSLGFVPNGGRVYYTMRSQPPLLVPMVADYLQTTGDIDFIRANIATLEKEYQFWMNNRTIEVELEGRRYRLARYAEGSSGPRPESYKEDVDYARAFGSESEKEEFYSELKSAAESGWDFSSRWFIGHEGGNRGNLTALKTRSLLPVDLNAFLCWNARLLSEFRRRLGDVPAAANWAKETARWQEALETVLWSESAGAWLDYDLSNRRPREYFAPSNLAPLWTKCYDPKKAHYFAERALLYLKRTGAGESPGGLPTTMEHSGEQWDFPNAWPPLQHMVAEGLEGTGEPAAADFALELADTWLRSNFRAYNETQAMYEKYDATVSGGHGGGGEYEVQLGFGWSNGVVMDLLDRYGGRVKSSEPWSSLAAQPEGVAAAASGTPTPAITASLALVATLAAGCLGLLIYSRRKSVATHGYTMVKSSDAGGNSRRPHVRSF